jgi:hypothetical protein
MTAVAFISTDIEQAQGDNRLRDLVAERLRPEFGECGKLFDALVDEVLGVLTKVLTTTVPGEVQPAHKPAVSRTLFQARPRWAGKLVVSFNPPQRGSVIGPNHWIFDTP